MRPRVGVNNVMFAEYLLSFWEPRILARARRNAQVTGSPKPLGVESPGGLMRQKHCYVTAHFLLELSLLSAASGGGGPPRGRERKGSL